MLSIRIKLRPAFLLLLLPLMLSACKEPVPDALIQLQGATGLRNYRVIGMDVVEYRLNERYPAQTVIDEISRQLQEKGWKPLPYSYMFPQYKSSHTVGWSIYKDPPKNPYRVIYEWSADWEDPGGNVVIYTLRYEDPYEKYTRKTFVVNPGNSSLQVTGLYMAREVALQRRNP